MLGQKRQGSTKIGWLLGALPCHSLSVANGTEHARSQRHFGLKSGNLLGRLAAFGWPIQDPPVLDAHVNRMNTKPKFWYETPKVNLATTVFASVLDFEKPKCLFVANFKQFRTAKVADAKHPNYRRLITAVFAWFTAEVTASVFHSSSVLRIGNCFLLGKTIFKMKCSNRLLASNGLTPKICSFGHMVARVQPVRLRKCIQSLPLLKFWMQAVAIRAIEITKRSISC